MAEVAPGALAPAVPVAPAVNTAPEILSTAEEITEAPEGGDKPEPLPEKTLTQSEVNKLIAKEKAKEQRRTERATREQLRAEVELEYLRKQGQPTQPQGEPGAPKQEDFKTYEDWLLAKAKHDVRTEMRDEQAKREKETAQQTQHREARQRAESMREKIAAAADEFPDLEDVISGEVPYTAPMVAFFEDMEAPGKLIHHLGTNVKEAQRIAALSSMAQVRELVKLEAQLSAAPKPTNTPAPIVPNKGNSAGTRSMLELDQEGFEARRKAHLAKKGRR